jgi:hypothetical protein
MTQPGAALIGAVPLHPEDKMSDVQFARCIWHWYVEWFQMIHGTPDGAWEAWGGR